MRTNANTSAAARKVWSLAVAAAVVASPAGAVQYIPIYNINLMGGQYFFSGQKSNINGNASANITPVVKFNDRWSLVPIYNANYQGTKQVTDSVGAGTLYQQSMSHRASFLGIYKPVGTTWRLKPNMSVKREFLKETRDEAWGKGLFDYWKYGLGFEAENIYKEPFSYRVGYDFYYVKFPNYQSLESQAGVDPFGNPLSRAGAGKNVLDTINNQVSMSISRPLPYDDPKVSLSAGYSMNWQKFPDQPIVALTGQPIGKKRQDFIQSLSLGVARPQALRDGDYRLVSNLGIGFQHTGSNQNEFDTTQAKFIADAYSSVQWSIGPSFSLAWGEQKQPTVATLGLTFSSTQYAGRLAQNSSGVYLDEKQYQNRTLLSLGYSYPIAPNFSLKAQTNFLWASSNMAYQQNYRYTYSTANYLFGFTYDY
ncbi:MAG: hypothetical protein HY078_10125 [Elusimicrobia bacterium]|nr:hypothetical protein [Elusimicrobiota bacterium]